MRRKSPGHWAHAPDNTCHTRNIDGHSRYAPSTAERKRGTHFSRAADLKIFFRKASRRMESELSLACTSLIEQTLSFVATEGDAIHPRV